MFKIALNATQSLANQCESVCNTVNILIYNRDTIKYQSFRKVTSTKDKVKATALAQNFSIYNYD